MFDGSQVSLDAVEKR